MLMSELKLLLSKARQQGYLLKSEVLDVLPDEIEDRDSINQILRMISDMGITIKDSE